MKAAVIAFLILCLAPCPNVDDVNHHQRRDREIAKLLITVVLVFIACHSFRMVLNVYEVFHLAYYGDIQDQWPAW